MITNPAHEGFVKIGVTEDIQARLRQYQTCDPNRAYKVEHYVFHPDCYKAEKQIHEMMKYFAKSRFKEWFECDIAVAKVRLDELIDDLK
jgi:hypothetical protein